MHRKDMILVSPLDTADQLDMLQVHELRRENGNEVVIFMCGCVKTSSQIYADSMPNQVGLKNLNLQIINCNPGTFTHIKNHQTVNGNTRIFIANG